MSCPDAPAVTVNCSRVLSVRTEGNHGRGGLRRKLRKIPRNAKIRLYTKNFEYPELWDRFLELFILFVLFSVYFFLWG